MRRQFAALSAGAACAAGVVAATVAPSSRSLSPEPCTRVSSAVLTARPLAFERNDGQTDARVRFVARSTGGTVFVEDAGLTIAPRQGGAPLRLRFDGALAREVVGGERLPGVVHYLRGDDPSKWRRDVPLHAAATCRAVWPGVDVVFHGDAGRVEYDFDVAPGADPDAISLAFEGADSVAVEPSGDLVVRGGGGEFRHLRPRVLQGDREIAGAFVAKTGGRIGFRVPGRDPSQALVIDPVIAYATYVGGSDAEQAFDIAVDPAGSVYLTGTVSSTDYPVVNPIPGAPGAGSGDAFVSKLNASGAKLLFSTYFGGGGTDAGWAIRADASGVCIAGSTTSPDFPRVLALQQTFGGGSPEGDAFLVKLTPTGSDILFATYLGGAGDDACRGLALGNGGNVYVGGFTSSPNFPTTTGAFQRTLRGASDGWVAKINTGTGALAWSTYLGGSDAPDAVAAVNLDAAQNVVVTGYTASFDFPYVTGGLQQFHGGGTLDGFVTKLGTGGALVASTYLGGIGDDACRRVEIDSVGNVCVAGLTHSVNFPKKNAVQLLQGGSDNAGDGFVTELNPQLSALVFSTYLGGNDFDDVQGLGISADGSVFVAGNTASTNFRSVNAMQAGFGGDHDAFVAKFAPGGASLDWSTYYGGTGYEAGTALAVDDRGDAYLAASVAGAPLPTLCAVQPSFAGGQTDVYVVKLSGSASAVPAAPVAPKATAETPYRVKLTWADASGNECGQRAERRVEDGEYAPLALLDTNVTSLVDQDGIVPDRTFTYRLFAVNPLGESPASAEASVTTPQTLVLSQRAGSLKESASRLRDMLRVQTLLRFTVDSADHTMHPMTEHVEIAVGAEDDPLHIDIPANDPRWKKGKKERFTWTSAKRVRPRVRVDVDMRNLLLTLTLTKLDFPTSPNGSIFLSVRAGDDAGHAVRIWTAKKRVGTFRLP